MKNIRLITADMLDVPEVRELFALAMMDTKVPFDPAQKYQLIIKLISARQRSRKPFE